MDTISRKHAIEKAENQHYLGIITEREKNIIIKFIEKLPFAQPETAKRIVGKSKDGMTFWYQCNICHEPVDEKDAFCRGCGRRFTDG